MAHPKGKRDKPHCFIRPGGEAVLRRVGTREAAYPVLGHFLSFLARDMASHPWRLQAVDTGLAQRIRSLVSDVEVDLDAALPAGDG